MREDRTERELKAIFQALRSEEERLAPSFEHLVRTAVRGVPQAARPLPLWARLTGAAAVAATLILAQGVCPSRQRHPAVDLEAWSTLSLWTPSTDAFLEGSGPRWESVLITTPSDTWMDAALETDDRLSTTEEML